MRTKMIWGNLASSDLEKTAKFYTDLGFKENCQRTEELVSIVFAENLFVINFFADKRFESALKGKITNTKNDNEIIFSLSADSREDVDSWFEKVKQAGGVIFSDPDGHKFNFLYWPGM